MNFNTLEIKDTYKFSGAKKAVDFSKDAEFKGQNFKNVTQEKRNKDKNDHKFKESHVKSQDEYEQDQKYYENKKE